MGIPKCIPTMCPFNEDDSFFCTVPLQLLRYLYFYVLPFFVFSVTVQGAIGLRPFQLPCLIQFSLGLMLFFFHLQISPTCFQFFNAVNVRFKLWWEGVTEEKLLSAGVRGPVRLYLTGWKGPQPSLGLPEQLMVSKEMTFKETDFLLLVLSCFGSGTRARYVLNSLRMFHHLIMVKIQICS